MVEYIEIHKIKDFPNHPFKVKDDDNMNILIKSIREYGVLVPVIVRQKDDGSYEMISVHRRKKACELLGIKKNL
ncbi:MAG TPA: ParB N-terminal domain-containing protein [Candidatus Merdicola faecigallinarum]|uniref:ParB N-terminal domain-containing protein n=1 Tax=Candidatus Merdicola faecigallinarum TaxID=2840862 RepID=A0A9D1M167_9FIRM|nr:ParB N-terminal domain-containing protein [Candidatus Merdicola faecigallinarum]